MKQISKLFIFLTSALFAMSTFSCYNLEDDDYQISLESGTKDAYITFGKTSARTVTPTITDDDFSSLVFKGAKSGESESTLASWESISEMQSAIVAVATGMWTFSLTATAGCSTYTGSVEKQISTGENALSFTLSLSDSGTETGAFEITVSYEDAANASAVSYAVATLENTDRTSVEGISSEKLTPSENSVAYSAKGIAAGTYRAKIVFYASSENDGDFVLATYREFVQISSGLTSKASRTLESLDELYTITYDLGKGKLADGESAQETFTRKTSVILPKVTRTGFTFNGWTDGDSKSIGTLKASDGSTSYGWSAGTYTDNVTLTAKWTANTDTKYTVCHYQQNADDDGYTLKDTDNLTGTTGEQTAATAKSYGHFTAQAFSQAEIAADGSTKITVKYDRETITFTLDLAGGTLDGKTGSITKTGKYGQSITVNDPARAGYTFTGWNSEGGTIASKYETDTTYTAQWKANSIGITASAPTYSDKDLGLYKSSESDTSITFTAASGTSSYAWYVDGIKQDSTSNTFSISISGCDAGSYTVMLVVDKKYSAIVEVAVSK